MYDNIYKLKLVQVIITFLISHTIHISFPKYTFAIFNTIEF